MLISLFVLVKPYVFVNILLWSNMMARLPIAFIIWEFSTLKPKRRLSLCQPPMCWHYNNVLLPDVQAINKRKKNKQLLTCMSFNGDNGWGHIWINSGFIFTYLHNLWIFFLDNCKRFNILIKSLLHGYDFFKKSVFLSSIR